MRNAPTPQSRSRSSFRINMVVHAIPVWHPDGSGCKSHSISRFWAKKYDATIISKYPGAAESGLPCFTRRKVQLVEIDAVLQRDCVVFSCKENLFVSSEYFNHMISSYVLWKYTVMVFRFTKNPALTNKPTNQSINQPINELVQRVQHRLFTCSTPFSVKKTRKYWKWKSRDSSITFYTRKNIIRSSEIWTNMKSFSCSTKSRRLRKKKIHGKLTSADTNVWNATELTGCPVLSAYEEDAGRISLCSISASPKHIPLLHTTLFREKSKEDLSKESFELIEHHTDRFITIAGKGQKNPVFWMDFPNDFLETKIVHQLLK